MAPEPLPDYERRRLENIRRNGEVMASLLIRRKAAELNSSLSSSSSSSQPKELQKQPPASPSSRSPVVLRRSVRTRGLPPPGPSPSDSSPSPSSSPEKPDLPPRPDIFPISNASVTKNPSKNLISAILDADLGSKLHIDADSGKIDPEEGYQGMVLRPENVRKVVPDRILVVQFLPVGGRSVVAVGNKAGNLGFWDLDCGKGEEESGADGVFVYLPHKGPVSGISAHPDSPRKVRITSYI